MSQHDVKLSPKVSHIAIRVKDNSSPSWMPTFILNKRNKRVSADNELSLTLFTANVKPFNYF